MPYSDYDEDNDAPQDIDLAWDDDENEEDVIDCPSCGKSVHEDADLCPYCGHWLMDESPAARRSRGWFWPVMVAIVIAIILVVWHGLRR